MGRNFRLYVCSDIHASEVTWRKLLNAVRTNVYRVDAVLIAGDLTGKAMVPIVQDETGEYVATVLGQRRVAHNQDDLAALERSIADLGYYGVCLSKVEFAKLEADPGLVKAHFREKIQQRLENWMALAADRLDSTGIPVLLMPGNDDDFDIDGILESATYCQNVNEQVVQLTPWHHLASMGWSSPTPWSTPRELPEEEFLDRASTLLRSVPSPRRSILMTHVPPYNSGLDTAPILSPDLRPTISAGDVLRGPVGSIGVRKAIETFQPMLGVHGHIHESPGECRIGDTVCVNAGSESSMGILRGILIDISSSGVERTMRVEG